MLAGQRGVQSALHQLLAGPRDGVDAGIECLGNLAVAPSLAGVRGIGLQQDARLQHLARWAFAGLDQRGQLLPLLSAQPHDILLHNRLFRGHDASPALPERSIQRLTAESTTLGTSALSRSYCRV